MKTQSEDLKLRFGMRLHTFKSITQRNEQLSWHYPQHNVLSSGPQYERKNENDGLPPSAGVSLAHIG